MDNKIVMIVAKTGSGWIKQLLQQQAAIDKIVQITVTISTIKARHIAATTALSDNNKF